MGKKWQKSGGRVPSLFNPVALKIAKTPLSFAIWSAIVLKLESVLVRASKCSTKRKIAFFEEQINVSGTRLYSIEVYSFPLIL